MRMITATEANRDFSKLLEDVTAGEVIGITKHGHMVATISPVKTIADEAESFKRDHLARLREQPCLGIPRGTRDELYDD
ncbi:type II toxin-antitoxin system Phd/YefM family antitoxin [soil metagenome]